MDDGKRVIRHLTNLQIHKPRLWERLVLLFCRLHKMEGDAGTVEYKYFLDRLYIYRSTPNAPLQLIVPWDGGANHPWMN